MPTIAVDVEVIRWLRPLLHEIFSFHHQPCFTTSLRPQLSAGLFLSQKDQPPLTGLLERRCDLAYCYTQ